MIHTLGRSLQLTALSRNLQDKMKISFASSFWLVTLSTFSTSSNGLPFTRGDKRKSDQLDEGEAVVEHEGDIISITKHQTRRNNVVDRFFSSSEEDDESSLELLHEVRSIISNQTDFLVSTRRTLHKRPELMYQEKETAEVGQKVLQQLDIPFTTGWALNKNPDVFPGPGGYGIVADIGTGGQPCVLLRADMDALPIVERTDGVDAFKSQNPNEMHACG